jgi:hypothetical protein
MNKKIITTDLLIVGSGAGGALIFYEMSKKRQTLMIEEGNFSSKDLMFESGFLSICKTYRKSGIYPTYSKYNLTLGEGKAVGGSTEVNGGLFWETPDHIIVKWKKMLGSDFDVSFYNYNFKYIEKLLDVNIEKSIKNYDEDSEVFALGATNLNWKVANAKRATTNCERRNLCASGCKSGAKNSMSKSLIPMGVAFGGKIIQGLRAQSINYGQKIKVLVKNEFESFEINCNELILSCGAIESPKLLMKSGLIKKEKINVGIHINLKIVAIYEKELNADRGTIFTKQVQEFLDKGVLMMPANFNTLYLSLASFGFSDTTFKKVIDNKTKSGLITLQVDVKSKLTYIPFLRKFLGPFFRLSDSDFELIKDYLIKVAELLFSSGAKQILLPIYNSKFLFNFEEAITFINSLKKKELIMSTVHFMNSLQLDSVSFDKLGRLRDYPKISVLDASVLPTNTVESPQGSIMALVRYLLLKRQ